jgi:hypothetical protein
MSENFLSFVTNVAPKAAKAGADVSGNPESTNPQGAEFAGIFKKEQAKTQGLGDPVAQLDGDAPWLQETGEDGQQSRLDESATTTETPVALPVLPASGNSLPELSIHSRGLQVGRVILTTANPKVSEESLNQFAQSQAGDVAPLNPESLRSPQVAQTPPQTRGILDGLMGQQQTGTNVQAMPAVQAVPPQLQSGAITPGTKPGMTPPRQTFGDWRQYTQPGSPVVPQNRLESGVAPVADGLAAKDVLAANMSKDVVTKVTVQAQDTSSRPPLTSMMTGDISPERMVDPALVLAGTDTAGDLPQAPSAPVASTGTSIPQGALAQSPATVISGGLAEALTSTDSTQMQSRLQPYQAWAQRFGEVLAQKLSLAVKDGNWSVKLNLNPASLGPVGVELQVNNGGIEGQIAANDANVRQLLNDSLPRLRQSLEALVSDNAGVNIELSDQRENGTKQQREPDVEIPLDLLAEEFIPLKEAIAGGNILRDGLSVFV